MPWNDMENKNIMKKKGDGNMNETKDPIVEINEMLSKLKDKNCTREIEIVRKVAYSLLMTSEGR